MIKTLPSCGPTCVPRTDPIASVDHVVALKALAHLDRLRVFFHLVQAGEPLPAYAMQRALALPGPTLSHHLDQLERAGLIDRERHERCIDSSVRRDLVADLVRLLTACC